MVKSVLKLNGKFKSFKGKKGVDYGVRLEEFDDPKSEVELPDGDHSVFGLNAAQAAPYKLKIGKGASDVWLRGEAPWGGLSIDAKAGDHKILVDHVGSKGVKVKLGDGDTHVSLGTSAFDDKSKIDGGDGDYKISAGGLQHVKLGDGSHLINVGVVESVEIGAGDSQIAFHSGDGRDEQIIMAGTGDHLVLGVAENAQAETTIALGGGEGSFVTLENTYWSASVSAGEGNHRVHLEAAHTATISLAAGDPYSASGKGKKGGKSKKHDKGKKSAEPAEGDQTLVIEKVLDKASILLGRGDHAVFVGTSENDDESTIIAAEGDSRIWANDLAAVTLGAGDHVVRVEDADQIRIGDGASIVSARDVRDIVLGSGAHVVKAGEVSSIEAGGGQHALIFEATAGKKGAEVETHGAGADVIVAIGAVAAAGAKIKTHYGDDVIVLAGDNWKKAEVDGGQGHDTVYIDASLVGAKDLKLTNVETVIVIPGDTLDSEFLSSIGVNAAQADLEIGEVFAYAAFDIEIGADGGVSVDWAEPPEFLDFDLIPTPDPSGQGAVVDLIYDGPLFRGNSQKSREDRLMESSDAFFLKVDSYQQTSQSNAGGLFDEAGYNEFGDLAGTRNDDTINDVRGASYIFCLDGDDIANGQIGDDRIHGGDGNDMLRGGAGQDVLDGGRGDDTLNGGEGIDIFVFRKGDGLTDIEDFELSYDILDVEGFDDLTYDALTEAGRQIGDDVVYDLGPDTLILRDVELATMVEIDLCIK